MYRDVRWHRRAAEGAPAPHRRRSAFHLNTPAWPPASSGRSLRLRPLPMTCA